MVKEGNTLKENENVLNDLPEEHETIVQMLSFIQEKWDVLQNDIKEKTSRYLAGRLKFMQGTFEYYLIVFNGLTKVKFRKYALISIV